MVSEAENGQNLPAMAEIIMARFSERGRSMMPCQQGRIHRMCASLGWSWICISFSTLMTRWAGCRADAYSVVPHFPAVVQAARTSGRHLLEDMEKGQPFMKLKNPVIKPIKNS